MMLAKYKSPYRNPSIENVLILLRNQSYSNQLSISYNSAGGKYGVSSLPGIPVYLDNL